MRTPGERTSGAWTGGCAIHPDGGDETDRTAGNSYTATPHNTQGANSGQVLLQPYELCIINSVNAAIALGEATARAVQRIPDAHCNGDMHAALDYAQKVKHEQKNFLNEQALKHIIEEGEQTS